MRPCVASDCGDVLCLCPDGYSVADKDSDKYAYPNVNGYLVCDSNDWPNKYANADNHSTQDGYANGYSGIREYGSPDEYPDKYSGVYSADDRADVYSCAYGDTNSDRYMDSVTDSNSGTADDYANLYSYITADRNAGRDFYSGTYRDMHRWLDGLCRIGFWE